MCTAQRHQGGEFGSKSRSISEDNLSCLYFVFVPIESFPLVNPLPWRYLAVQTERRGKAALSEKAVYLSNWWRKASPLLKHTLPHLRYRAKCVTLELLRFKRHRP
jgi:hypothetical protein